MHKATYHENELLDMALATENRATRLRKAIEHNRLVREQSRAGNAPEPEPTPCVEEEKPKTVTVVGAESCNTFRLSSIDRIVATQSVIGPVLVVNKHATTTPLADIIAQAAAAEMELPPVVVQDGEGGEWLEITAVDAFQRPEDDNVRSKIWGKEVKLGRYSLCTDNTTPGQLLALCTLAGWPKPEVRCEFHYCDGTVCEVDPADVRTATLFRRDTAMSKYTQIELFAQVDGSRWRDVREPVAVVQRMVDACKGSE